MDHERGKRIAARRAIGLCIGVALLLTGCGPAQVAASGPISDTPVANDCVGKIWVNETPKEDGKNLYFVGQSGSAATEKDARNEALTDATTHFVKFTGVQVSVLDQVLQEGQAKSSEVMDPTTTEKRRQELRAEAFVRRVKVQEYCTQRFQRVQGRTEVGTVYVTNALVAVPREEYDRVQERAKELLLKQQEQDEARRTAAVAGARTLFAAAQSDEKAGRLLSALQNLASVRKRLAEIQAMPESEAGDAPTDADVTGTERRLLAGLSLQALNPTQRVDPGEAPAALVVQASYAARSQAPVSGLPIVFAAGTAAMPALRTGPSGRADLQLPTLARVGEHRFVATIGVADLKGQISPEAEAYFQGLSAPFVVQVRERSLDERLADLVRQLAPPPGSRRMEVVIGNFTFGTTKAGGVFSEQLKAGLVTALAQHRERFLVKEAKPITRGLSVVSANSEGAIAQASGAKANLTGDYQLDGDWIVIHSRLVSATDDEILSTATTKIRKTMVKEDDLAPPNVSQAAQVAQVMTPTSARGDFKLDLGIDKGNGATYREGEDIHIFVQCEVACYLKLIYVEADGTRVRLVPSPIYHDSFLRAGEKKTFEFTVAGNPFGAESLLAFASTAPLPDDPGHDRGGLWVIDDKLESIASRSRGIASQGTARRSERGVTLTTLKK